MKKNSVFKKFHKDNKGMSLVEMIVAIAILSVAVAPILYTFVYTTNFNAKAKIRQRATNAAMSIMETFKSHEMTKAHELFTTGGQFLDYSTGAVYSFIPDPVEVTTDPDTLAGTYKITNMSFSTDSIDTHKYDVEIVAKKGRNETVTHTPLYDPHQDVIFAEDPAKQFDPYYIVDKIIGPGSGIDTTKLSSVEISRYITITVLSTGVKVDYRFTGSYVIDGETKPIDYSASTVPSATILSQTIGVTPFGPDDDEVIKHEKNEGDTLPLRDVYFYYYPAYKDVYTPEGESYIVNIVEDRLYLNNTYQETNLYIVKQKNNGKSYAHLKNSDTNYHLNIYYVAGLSANLNVFDVVNKNLADESSRPTFFGTLTEGVSHTGTIKLLHGLDDPSIVPEVSQLYMTLTITVKENASAPRDAGKELAVIKGTVFE